MAPKFSSLLRPSLLRPLPLKQTHIPKPPISALPNPSPTSNLTPSLSQPKTSLFPPKYPFLFYSRAFSSAPSSSNIVLIGSEQGFNTAFSKVQDEKLPAIFYFTAVWCGPCRMLSPVIEEMSKKFPHVTTYKIDIDQEGLGSILSNLQISSVPTLHFFQDGKKAAEMVGADPTRLKSTMENLYKIRSSKLYSDESWPVNLDASKRAFGFPFIMAVMFLLFRSHGRYVYIQFSDINDPDFRVKPGYKESPSSNVRTTNS